MAYSKTASSTRTKKRSKQTVVSGIACIKASFNNTFVTITDGSGNALVSATAGSSGFKGSRKSTPFAARMAAEKVGTVARDEFGMKTLIIRVNGPGPGRDSALQALGALGFQILFIKDVSRYPRGGGCRPPKARRV